MAVSQNLFVSAQAFRGDQAVVTAAKTTYADNANAVLLATAAANGSVFYSITAIPRGVLAAATKVMLFVSPDSGTTLHYLRSVLVAAYATDAATSQPTMADFGFSETAPLRLEGGGTPERLYVGGFAAAANGIVVAAQGEDL
jgi:hypothetical protein